MKLVTIPILLLLGSQAVSALPVDVEAAEGGQTPILAGSSSYHKEHPVLADDAKPRFHDHHPIPEGAAVSAYHDTHPVDMDAKPRFHDHHPIPEGADPAYHDTHPVDADAKPRFHDHHPIPEGADPAYHATHPVDAIQEDRPDAGEEEDAEGFTIPTRQESTKLGRRLLALSTTGVLTTDFPANLTSEDGYGRTPPSLRSTPIGLPEYVASCEAGGNGGNPTLLALRVSTSTKNALAGSNASLAVSWWDEYERRRGPGSRPVWSQANLPRLSVTGYLEEIEPETVVERAKIEACFIATHPDSVMWLPGRKSAAHAGMWMRLVVQEIYWIGGFGDRNFIGWFDPEEWAAVTKEEWEGVRLPGEKA